MIPNIAVNMIPVIVKCTQKFGQKNGGGHFTALNMIPTTVGIFTAISLVHCTAEPNKTLRMELMQRYRH